MGDDMAGMGQMAMLGDYPMNREASGAAWGPDSAPMDGWMSMRGDGWMTMLHGDVTVTADRQSGRRGGDQAFLAGMVMGMASHAAGPGRLTLKLMVSPDPFMGKAGYPRLFQTGETADGVHPLVDRQHPHDAVGELAGVYSINLSKVVSTFVYVAYPGEPALGPAAYLHRGSGNASPVAPISHHWIDSTHVAFGVATAGVIWGGAKLEASRFTGREPDQYRWSFDKPRFDSTSVRVTLNPSPDWSLQASRGWIVSPEQLEPLVNQTRTTVSASWAHAFGGWTWQATAAFGRNSFTDGRQTDAAILEATAAIGEHVLFARAEQAQKDELFSAPSPLAGPARTVSELSAGYIRYFAVADHLKLGLGGQGGVYHAPRALDSVYGAHPYEAELFIRLKIS